MSSTTTSDARTSTSDEPRAIGGHAATAHAYDAGLLLLRIVVATIAFAHGTQKLFGWFHGGGISGTGMFFSMSGYPDGKTFAVVAGLSETLGGLGLLLGLLTPLAGAAVLGALINAVAVKWNGGFFSPQGYEFEMLVAASAAALALTGPGRYAVDRFVPGLRAHRLAYGSIGVALGVVVAGVVLLIRK